METPGRARRVRKSVTPNENKNTTDDSDAFPATLNGKDVTHRSREHKQANGNVASKSRTNGGVQASAGGKDPRIDYSGHLEFGGPWGVSLMMTGFPL